MIPLQLLPGHAHWGASLDALVAHPGPLWVCGASGTGVTTLAKDLATRRRAGLLDDAEHLAPAALEAWIDANPEGVIASHLGSGESAVQGSVSRCLILRLPALEEDPGSVGACLAHLAGEEGLPGALPPALAALPCPGNLRGLRNRLVRWKLLGQLPEDAPEPPGGAGLPLETEDLAANLHVLERILLHRALRRSYGNRVEAARRLGVSRRQLYLLIARHGDPVRGETATSDGPKRLTKNQAK